MQQIKQYRVMDHNLWSSKIYPFFVCVAIVTVIRVVENVEIIGRVLIVVVRFVPDFVIFGQQTEFWPTTIIHK